MHLFNDFVVLGQVLLGRQLDENGTTLAPAFVPGVQQHVIDNEADVLGLKHGLREQRETYEIRN